MMRFFTSMFFLAAVLDGIVLISGADVSARMALEDVSFFKLMLGGFALYLTGER